MGYGLAVRARVFPERTDCYNVQQPSRPMPSIRQKISLSFYAFAAIVALLSALAFSDLRYLEWRIGSGTAIADFVEAVLELRRYEKNYFLYGTRADLETAATFVDTASGLLGSSRETFLGLAGEASVLQVEVALDRYREKLGALGNLAANADLERTRLQDEVRDLGHELAEAAEAVARSDRAELAGTAQRAQGGLVATVILVSLLGIGAARVLSRTAVQPMAWLESKLAAIGEGHFNPVDPLSRDREIVSMSRAVNRMLGEIETRNRQLVQSEKLASLGTLVSGVAHELNNPLSNISSSCQILIEELREGGSDDPLQWLQQIDEETERARRIVQTLLEFSRDRRFAKQTLLLRPVVEQALLLLGRRKRARVSLDLPAALQVNGDPQRLQQILVNLVKNAEDAGGPEVNIRISARLLPGHDFRLPDGAVSGRSACPARKGNRVLVIEVEDDGPGIPPEVLPRIFDPFFTTKDVGHGSGLGLYVTQEIVDQHDGCIGVVSRPGQGTRFVVGLPHPDEEPST